MFTKKTNLSRKDPSIKDFLFFVVLLDHMTNRSVNTKKRRKCQKISKRTLNIILFHDIPPKTVQCTVLSIVTHHLKRVKNNIINY